MYSSSQQAIFSTERPKYNWSFDTDDSAVSTTHFHQNTPHHICQDRYPGRKGKCRNPRCSLECRTHFARKQAAALSRQLKALPQNYHIYFGVLKILHDCTKADHQKARREFLKQLCTLAKKRQATIKFRAMSEIGSERRIHYHYALYADIPIGQTELRNMWSAACSGRRTIVEHGPPRNGIEPAAKYMCKDLRAVRERSQCVILLAHKSPDVTWGSRGFFPKGIEVLWEECVKEWKGEDFQDCKRKETSRTRPRFRKTNRLAASRVQQAVPRFPFPVIQARRPAQQPRFVMKDNRCRAPPQCSRLYVPAGQRPAGTAGQDNTSPLKRVS